MKIGPLTLFDTMASMEPLCRIEDIEDAFQKIVWMNTSSPWWIGDTLVFGEARFGDDIWQIVPETYSERHLQRLMAQCRKIKPTDRVAGLFWTHHGIVAGIKDPLLQRSLLRKAAEDRMDTRAFKQYVDGAINAKKESDL